MNPKLIDVITSLTSNTSPAALPGWCSPEKALRLAALVIAERPRLLVELGVFGGRSFAPMAIAMAELVPGTSANEAPINRLAVGIDPWTHEACIEGMDPHDANDQKNIEYWSKVPLHDVHRRAMGALDNHKLWGIASLLQARAERVVNLFADGAIDFLHIDDNHHTASRTVELWLPKCRPGATIVFDDTNWAETQAGLVLLATMATLISDHGDHRIYRKN